jgi:pimeloyl-ACP methyl ester carboxylesterase
MSDLLHSIIQASYDASNSRNQHGLSDFQPHRRLVDWPDDVSAFADALGLARCAVLGMSAGGPYVLACAQQPWGFSLPDVRMPVALWHGERDQNVPAAWGHYLAETLPGCAAHFLPDGGHLLVFNHLDTMLTELLA